MPWSSFFPVKESGVEQLSDESLMTRVRHSDDAAAFAERMRALRAYKALQDLLEGTDG